MGRKMGRQLCGLSTALLLAVVLVPLTGTGVALACADLPLDTEYVVYDGLDGKRYIDGVITNDTSVTVQPENVQITFTEEPGETHDGWISADPLAPDERVTFHVDWPSSAVDTWTPSVVGFGYKTTAARALPLTIESVSAPATEGAGWRTYTLSIYNPNAFPVGDIRAFGTERDGRTLLDTVEGVCLPCELGAQQRTDIEVSGLASSAVTPVLETSVTAYELPTVTISADTLNPLYGSQLTLTVELRHSDGTLVTGPRTLKLLTNDGGGEECASQPARSVQCGDNWTYRWTTTTTGRAVFTALPTGPTYYKGAYWEGNGFASAESDEIYVVPRVAASAPTAPSSVRVGRSFKVKGRMNSGAKCVGKPIKVIAERRVGSRWVKKISQSAQRDTSGNYYKSIKLNRSGKYRVRAYRSGVGYSKAKLVRAHW